MYIWKIKYVKYIEHILQNREESCAVFKSCTDTCNMYKGMCKNTHTCIAIKGTETLFINIIIS